MTEAFNDWWDSDISSADNPFLKNSPAYWAWEGWMAGVKAEREACAKVCEEHWYIDGEHTAYEFARIIRARGNA